MFCVIPGVHCIETLINAATVDSKGDESLSLAKRGSAYKRLPAWSVYYGKRSGNTQPEFNSFLDKDRGDLESEVTDNDNASDFGQYNNEADTVSGLSKRASFKRLHSWMSTYGKRSMDDPLKVDSIETEDTDELDSLELSDDTKLDEPMVKEYFDEQEKRVPGWSATYGKRVPGWAATYGKRAPMWSATYGKRVPGWAATYGKRVPGWAATYGKRIPGWSATYGKRAMWQAGYGKRFNTRNSFSERLNTLREHLNTESNNKTENKRMQAWNAFYGR